MKLIPLGVGGAFTERFYHNNYVAEIGTKKLLIDAGTTLRESMKKAGYSYVDIDSVWISHLHFDHAGGLEELVMQRFWQFKDGQHTPIKTPIFVHQKVYSQLRKLLSAALDNQGRTVDDFCEFTVVNDQDIIHFEGVELQIFDTTNSHAKGLVSSGLFIKGPLGNVLFPSDVKDLDKANLLRFVNDDTLAIFQDTSFTFNGVHAQFKDVLAYYPKEIHSSIYAMHYNDNIEDYLQEIERAGIQYVKQREPITLPLK